MPELTCGEYLVERAVLLTWLVAGNVVSESDGCHGDEAVVEGVQVIPVLFQVAEDGGRDEEDEDEQQRRDDAQVDQPDVERPAGGRTRQHSRDE